MSLKNQHNCRRANHAEMQQSHTARFNLPVRHPSLWRFILDQLLAPPRRIHSYRNLSTRMLEEMLDEIDRRHCQ